MFTQKYPLDQVRGADYNPRKIDESSFSLLKQSLTDLGCVKPLIVDETGLIIAGHQRSKAMKELLWESAPVYQIPSLSISDEVRFNQLHNGSEDTGQAYASVSPVTFLKWGTIPANSITGDFRSPGAEIRKELCSLMNRFGNFGGACITQGGKVVDGRNYLLACSLIGLDSRVFVIPDLKYETAVSYFSQDYGDYSYDHLPRTTWNQSFCQMFRLRGKLQKPSTLYESYVIPNITKDMRVLDFGAGQCDYAKLLNKKGYNVVPIEFYLRIGNRINKRGVYRLINNLLRNVERFGLFDAVVCDGVMNSVDSLTAEHDVLNCLHGFCKQNGHIYISGRPRKNNAAFTKITNKHRRIEFLDRHGFSGYLFNGMWKYQKYHTKQQVEDYITNYFGDILDITWGSAMYHLVATKTVKRDKQDVLNSIRREFDLMWPDESINMGQDATNIMERLL